MALTKIEASNIAAGAVASSGFNSVQVFTASGTWTKPAGITKVVIEVQGGGGGGGNSASGVHYYYIGGSGGGYAKKFIDVSSVTASVITVGAAGVGATGSGGAGTDGGDSSWVDTASGGSSTVTGVKGVSIYSSYGTATGGAATGGDININGGDGGGLQEGQAGGSMLGNGGKNGYTGSQPAPSAGSGYGAGGGGAYDMNAADASPGIVIVWEYK